jgi:hypothetical protein
VFRAAASDRAPSAPMLMMVNSSPASVALFSKAAAGDYQQLRLPALFSSSKGSEKTDRSLDSS